MHGKNTKLDKLRFTVRFKTVYHGNSNSPELSIESEVVIGNVLDIDCITAVTIRGFRYLFAGCQHQCSISHTLRALYLFGNSPDNESALSEISIPNHISAPLSLSEWKRYPAPEFSYKYILVFRKTLQK
jgi:hypothetical protein